jgi:CMP-N,N'-diacetyllegionaminic acid synthase
MFKKKKILAIIPARKGSKGLKFKNTKILNRLPLYLHSLKFALKCKFIDKVCITTDSQKIIKNVSKYKKVFSIKRNKKLSSDKAETKDVILDVFKKNKNLSFDYFILLEPTSPLRSFLDIKKALNKIILSNCDNIVSISENIICSPEFLYSIKKKNIIKPYLSEKKHVRRQDIKVKTYFINGTFYISNVNRFLKSKNLFHNCLGYKTHKKFSFEIDDFFDFNLFKKLI